MIPHHFYSKWQYDFNILFGTWGLLSLRFFFLDLSKLDILYDEFFGDEIKVFIFTFLNPFHDILLKCWMSCHFFFLTSTSWWLFILISWVISDLMSSSSGNLVKGIKPNSQPVRNKKNRENTHQRKTITRTRQYLRGLTICLRPRSCRDITIIREEYRVQHAATIFSLYI